VKYTPKILMLSTGCNKVDCNVIDGGITVEWRVLNEMILHLSGLISSPCSWVSRMKQSAMCYMESDCSAKTL
jgi:hypothetical protein